MRKLTRFVSKADDGKGREYSPSANEHPDGLGGRLDRSRNNHDQSADEDCRPASNTIRQVWCEGVPGETADILFVQVSLEVIHAQVSSLLGWR